MEILSCFSQIWEKDLFNLIGGLIVNNMKIITAFEICFSSKQMSRLLLRYIYVFKYLPSQKNAEAIEFLGILKNTFPKIMKNMFLFSKEKKHFAS